MRYLLSSSLCISSVVMSSSLQAFQLQLRAFQSHATLSHRGGDVPVVWSGSYLNSTEQTTSSSQGSAQKVMDSLGHELSLGFELAYPHVYVDAGIAQVHYYPGPNRKIEDLAPKVGLQFITNVQDRWMPYARVGISYHHLKLIADRVETREIPASLGLSNSSDRFAVQHEWDDPRLWNGDLSLGCKLYPVPTTAIVVEYRYSRSFDTVTIHEKETGINSFTNDAGFVSERELSGARLTSQELSLAIEVEL